MGESQCKAGGGYEAFAICVGNSHCYGRSRQPLALIRPLGRCHNVEMVAGEGRQTYGGTTAS
jgi:hypothetical protein